MNFQDFCEQVKDAVQSSLGAAYNARLVKTDKLNGLTLISLVILKEGDIIAPNIYLEPFYSEFQLCGHVSLIADKVLSLYQSVNKRPELADIPFSDYNTVKDRLFCKLINYGRNQSLLSSIPHIRYMDLAVIFCILVKKDDDGFASITVNNDLMEQWAVTADILNKKALENTPLLFEFTVQPMEDIISSIINDQLLPCDDNNGMNKNLPDFLYPRNSSGKIPAMYVASNKYGLNGAAWLLQKNELQALSRKLSSNLYILPSSIHEIIVIPYTNGISKNDLFTMVQEVNTTQVAPDEFLADNVYLYTQEDDAILPLF
jgi:hypothetical protein